jgi:hypothetical protein
LGQQATIHSARNGSLPVTLYHWFVGDRVFQLAEDGVGLPPSEQFGYRSLLSDAAFSSTGALPGAP